MRRSIVLALVLLGALALGLPASMSAWPGARAPARPAPQDGSGHTQYLPLIRADWAPGPLPSSPFGVTMYHGIGQEHGTAEARAAGVDWVTTFIDWREIEPSEGQLVWDGFDRRVASASAAGLHVFALFLGDPAWAWMPDRPETDPQKRLRFVRLMAERYDCDGADDAPGHLCVQYWSFYPEPDAHVAHLAATPGAKGYWGRRGAAFAEMIAGVADAIHAQNPNARVLIGGLAYDWFEDQGGIFVRSFLGDVLGALSREHGGAGRYLDAVAFHHYLLGFPDIRDKASAIRSTMREHGVGDLPLLVPEGGFWSAASAGSSEARQAQWLVQLYARAMSVDIRQISWHSVFDDGAGTEEHGLFWQSDLSRPKLAYAAYRTMTRELAGAAYVRALGQAGAEGHVFGQGGVEKTVLWATGAAQDVRFAGGCVRLVDLAGAQTLIRDGSSADRDRRTNGAVSIAAAVDTPVYVSACP